VAGRFLWWLCRGGSRDIGFCGPFCSFLSDIRICFARLEALGGAHVAGSVARLDRFLNSAHPDRPGAACCCRFERMIGDEYSVMRSVPELERATLVFARA